MVIKVFFGHAAVACALFSAGCSSDEEPANGGIGGTSGGGAGGSAGSDAGEDAGPLTTNPFILSTSVFLKNGNTNLVFVNHIAEPGKRCTQRKSGACQVSVTASARRGCSERESESEAPSADNRVKARSFKSERPTSKRKRAAETAPRSSGASAKP
ncbi:MAG: hypothetical protein HS104_30410 [Polyangiaceae bacterium]|nr:hypothetical protein [Polyangiaceae bacterium]MCE7889153.1 hypothetical protein [Sorangiineae bacterium PRO1]MCL4755617.1 hypothetical protein [Myxococcales bacterium]